jgi:hypothetical protein
LNCESESPRFEAVQRRSFRENSTHNVDVTMESLMALSNLAVILAEDYLKDGRTLFCHRQCRYIGSEEDLL